MSEVTLARAWFQEFNIDFVANEKYLGDLDRQAGDGDFAVNLGSGLKRAEKRFQDLTDQSTDAEVFAAVSAAFLDTGGTSGPLFGMWFRGIAKALQTTGIDMDSISEGVAGGTATVQRLGGAQAGDKTMVDAMLPAVEALAEAATNKSDLHSGLLQAAASAREGAESTKNIEANLGRASYVGNVASGVVDPGAAAIALFFEAGARAATP